MRIRLHGHPDDLAHARHLLATVLNVDQVSRFYSDRPPSPHVRLYLDVHLPTPSPAPGDISPGRRDRAHPARHQPPT